MDPLDDDGVYYGKNVSRFLSPPPSLLLFLSISFSFSFSLHPFLSSVFMNSSFSLSPILLFPSLTLSSLLSLASSRSLCVSLSLLFLLCHSLPTLPSLPRWLSLSLFLSLPPFSSVSLTFSLALLCFPLSRFCSRILRLQVIHIRRTSPSILSDPFFPLLLFSSPALTMAVSFHRLIDLFLSPPLRSCNRLRG